ncbi:MAG: cation transporter [Marinilabiliaceae bacterium]|nr:cation transporter [Marinilabiliaceae bacterium]
MIISERSEKAQRITWLGFWVNLGLTLAKIMAGVFGRSSAMLADGIHSLSDFVTDLIVLAFVRVADKGCDEDHRYGHGKFETFATLLISLALVFVGIGIGWSGIVNIIRALGGEELGEPSLLALAAAIVSIASKEWLFRVTRKVGQSIQSQAVIANAWHHRSDALSSIGTMIGIGGAILLGGVWRMLDPIAGVIVSIFIIKVAIELGLPSVKELLESALPHETEAEILHIIHHTPGVRDSHRLRTRKIGNSYAIDIHVQLDRHISFVESHDIASLIERNLRERYGFQTHINIHTEPLKENKSQE